MKQINKYLIRFALIFIIFITACEKYFIANRQQRNIVTEKFELQKEIARNREKALFSVFNQNLTPDERGALKFLYAYLPLSDLADLHGEFLLRNVRLAFQARKEMPWGAAIPEEIFRHFVLPHRVNRENLDSARVVFYRELKDRVKNLSMAEAALEVNHWCHEKVTYRSTSYRVAAPLSMITAGFGRCGEESVFAVTALRSVGIPARTCYTPRWAHCDDNHAWIEIWIDGQWFYIGACEPSPRLNMGWFTGAANRGMFVFNQVYGDYFGPEELLYHQGGISQLNSTAIYAPTKKLVVQVVDSLHNPIPQAAVGFMLYNYGEFYSCLNLETDKSGHCAATTGLGDLLIWTHFENKFGYQKITVSETDTVRIIPVENGEREFNETLDLVPPIARPLAAAQLPDSEKVDNAKRLKYEDQLRADFAATWMKPAAAGEFARERLMEPKKIQQFVKKSRGNWPQIVDFLAAAPPKDRKWAVQLLETLEEKDFRDTKTAILTDHLNHALKYLPETDHKAEIDRFVRFILAPRIRYEFLLAYRSYFLENFAEISHKKLAENPDFLVNWIKTNIEIPARKDRFGVPLNPIGIFELKKSDERSLGVLYVAVNRTYGIASRLDPVDKKPQVWMNKPTPGKWLTVSLQEQKEQASPDFQKNSGAIILKNLSSDLDLQPEYEKHFTLARYKDGRYHTLDFYGTPFKDFENSTPLAAGNYLLATGNRLTDGTVLTDLTFFHLPAGETRTINFNLRKDESTLKIVGQLDPSCSVKALHSNQTLSFDSLSQAKGALIIWIEPDKEPTKHALQNLTALRQNFEKWNGPVLLVLNNTDHAAAKVIGDNFNLPKQIVWTVDENWQALAKIKANSGFLTGKLSAFPVFLLLDQQANIVGFSSGYRIGAGEQMLKVIKKMSK